MEANETLPRRVLAPISSASCCQSQRLGIVVPVLGPGSDGGDEVIDTGERISFQSAFGELREPAIDEAHPRRAGLWATHLVTGPALYAAVIFVVQSRRVSQYDRFHQVPCCLPGRHRFPVWGSVLMSPKL